MCGRHVTSSTPLLLPCQQDFQIKLLERKMSRLKGDVNTEEKQALELKTSQLAQTLEEKRRTAGLLTTQLKKLQDRKSVV